MKQDKSLTDMKQADSLFQGALLRTMGSGAISTFSAWAFHNYFTAPMSKVDFFDGMMAFTEISILGERQRSLFSAHVGTISQRIKFIYFYVHQGQQEFLLGCSGRSSTCCWTAVP